LSSQKKDSSGKHRVELNKHELCWSEFLCDFRGVRPSALLDISIIPYNGTEGLPPESNSSTVLIFAKHETLNCLFLNGPRSQLVH